MNLRRVVEDKNLLVQPVVEDSLKFRWVGNRLLGEDDSVSECSEEIGIANREGCIDLKEELMLVELVLTERNQLKRQVGVQNLLMGHRPVFLQVGGDNLRLH